MIKKILLITLISIFALSCKEDESLDDFYGVTKIAFQMESYKEQLLTIKVKKITLLNRREPGIPRPIKVTLDENGCIRAVYGTYIITVLADVTYKDGKGEIKELKNREVINERAYIGHYARPIDIKFR